MEDQNKSDSIESKSVGTITIEKDTSGPTLKEPKHETPKGSRLGPYFRIWGYGTSIDHLIRACGILAAFTNGAALPLMTLIFGDVVDKFNGLGDGTITSKDFMDAVSKNALWFTYLFIGIFALSFAMNTCFKITARRSIKKLRGDVVRSLVRQDITYFGSCSPGSVATLISNNANLIENGLGERLALAFEGLGQLIVAFIVAFARVWRLTLVVATMLPLTIAVIAAAVVVMSRLDVKILKIYGQAGGLAEEALSTMPIITAFGATKQIHEKYNLYLESAKKLGVKKGPIMGLQMSVQWAIMFCAYALAWFYGAQLVANSGGNVSGGNVLTVLTAILIGIISLTLIVPAVGEIAKASAAAEGLFEIIDRKSKIDPLSRDGRQPSSVVGHLRLENVSFAYPLRPAVKILHGLTLDFEAGKTTAIIGASGSGKSTLFALLTRWFDPDAGHVFLDGVDVRILNTHWLRRQIGYVQQEPVLLRDTIFNNICHGLFCTPQDQATREEKLDLVENACKQAFADQFIEQLPDKYNTHVGDRGGLLSGGQKQRIAIARSVIRDPPILLLDEATSALDPAAEGIVQKALNNVSKSRTTIIIAHKLSTVQKADKIIVLNKGRVMEQGSHQELLAKKGVYFALVNKEGLEEEHEQADSVPFDDAIETSTSEDTDNSAKDSTLHHFAPKPTSGGSRTQLTLFQSLEKIMKQQRHLWPFFMGGVLGSIGSGSVFAIEAVIFSRAILLFQLPLPEEAHKMKAQGSFGGLMFFALALGVLLFYAALGFCFTATAFHVSTFYRSKYFAKLLGQDISFFEREGQSASAATSRLSTDPQLLQDLIATNLGFILLSAVNVVASCALALAVGWKIAIVTIFGCLPPIFFAGFVRMRIEMTSQSCMAKIYLESTRLATEAVSVIRTVSSLAMEEKIMLMYDDRLNANSAQTLVQTIISNTLFALTESLYLATLALVFWWGAKLVSQHEYSIRDFYMVFIAVIFGGQAAGFMFGSALQTTKALNAIKDIMSLLASKPFINTSSGKKDFSEKQSDMAIEFKNVHFSYPNRPTISVIQDLSFTVKRGQSIGIVGASGSGKSTIVALIERFYDTASGTILFNSIPATELDVHAHRARIGLVSQDTMIYQGSILENVAFGVPEGTEVTEERIINACKEASIHEFIQSLPEGYGTDAGIRGISLSGGQRQRIAIARALVRDPQILLLDEATSALDSENERLVQQAIERATKVDPSRTTIAVAHRLSTIQRCDRILVLHAGRVVEQGTHAELMGRRGTYYQMAFAQKLDQEIS